MYGGMLYFPLKVNLFEEIAVELVEARFGLKGTAAVMKLLCKIHKEGGKGHQRAGDAGNRGHPGGESLFRPQNL